MEITDADILKITLRIESQGAAFYKAVSERITDANTKEFFLCMSREESSHEIQIRKMLQNKGDQLYGWENQSRLKDMIEKEFQTDIFPNIEDVFDHISEYEGIPKAVEFAIEAEKVSAEFYSLLGEFCNNFEAKTLLLMLEKNERDHLLQVENLRKKFAH